MKFLINDKKWPAPGSVPFLEVIEQISSDIDTSNINTFIECGSGETGDNAYYFSNFFDVISIENNPKLFKRYCNREGKNHNIKWILGDGVENLTQILTENPEERFIILLDDHNSHQSFIKEEMEAIASCSNRKDHVIIIDDMKFAGIGTYPTIEQLDLHVRKINPEYKMKNTEIGHDIFVVYTAKEKR